jgi:hypothetical protein
MESSYAFILRLALLAAPLVSALFAAGRALADAVLITGVSTKARNFF